MPSFIIGESSLPDAFRLFLLPLFRRAVGRQAGRHGGSFPRYPYISLARVLTCSHHAPRSGMKGVQGGKEKKKVRYTQEGPSRFAPHAAPAMCVFLSPSACSPLLSPLSVLPFPPTPPPARSDAHLILLSADRDVCVYVCAARAYTVPYVCLYTNIR